jgi:hypothetical protein
MIRSATVSSLNIGSWTVTFGSVVNVPFGRYTSLRCLM